MSAPYHPGLQRAHHAPAAGFCSFQSRTKQHQCTAAWCELYQFNVAEVGFRHRVKYARGWLPGAGHHAIPAAAAARAHCPGRHHHRHGTAGTAATATAGDSTSCRDEGDKSIGGAVYDGRSRPQPHLEGPEHKLLAPAAHHRPVVCGC